MGPVLRPRKAPAKLPLLTDAVVSTAFSEVARSA